MADLVTLQRSVAMLPPGQKYAVDRDQLHALCAELIEYRELIARLGTDLRNVAQRSRER